jgi:hypothetical protein
MRLLLPILLLLFMTPFVSAGEYGFEAKEYVEGYIPANSTGAPRDSIWNLAHAYRQWIYDQNYISDENSNLDPSIVFVADGGIRSHPDRVYFYNEISIAIQKAKDTGRALAFYLFDHTCAECLFILPQLYTQPEVVEASKDFVNCYVELPRQKSEADGTGMMSSSLTVQYFTPGLRRLRVVDSPDQAKLMKSYSDMLAYYEKLSDEERRQEPRKANWPKANGGY